MFHFVIRSGVVGKKNKWDLGLRLCKSSQNLLFILFYIFIRLSHLQEKTTIATPIFFILLQSTVCHAIVIE
jgi:hypothetical protein